MMPAHKLRFVFLLVIGIGLHMPLFLLSQEQDMESEPPPTEQQAPIQAKRVIRTISVVGNKSVSTDSLLNYVPYRIGDTVTLQPNGQIEGSAQLIRSLYTELKRFRNITLLGDLVEPDQLDLYILVEEKAPLKEVIFKGNKTIKDAEILKKVDINIPAVDAEELKVFADQIKKLYYEKGFQNVHISTSLVIDEEGYATAIFEFSEGKKSRIRRIRFEGNKAYSEKDLKDAIFTREEWIMSFLDKTGTFHPERLEADKHMVEQFYQNHGYLHAKVMNVEIVEEPGTNILTLIFQVEEGEPYRIKEVSAPGNDLVSEQFLLTNIPVRPGQLYSRERIGNTIKQMEFLWGNMGYIFASIEPSVTVDEDAKTVNVSFLSDIGKKITLNRITVKGNKKTRDKVIRRRISLREGEPVTQGGMDSSKHSISSMGYFDQRDGVNWKVQRINDEEANLDLIVKEAKTGHANVQLQFGGSGKNVNDVLSAVSVKGTLADSNLFGTGTAVNLEGSWSKDEQTLVFHLEQPWLFDKPISGALDIYHKRPSYDQLKHLQQAMHARITGGATTVGFLTNPRWSFLNRAQVLFSLGLDSLKYNRPPAIFSFSPADLPRGITRQQADAEYASIISKEFTPGGFLWFANHLEQDKRNHPIHTSRGHKWKMTAKVAVPSLDPETSGVRGDLEPRRLGFGKIFFDYAWYTPIINEVDLVFKLHLFFGFASPYSNKIIPFGELFHVGGDTTVRGFSYGEIGPKFVGDTIGGKKATFLNAELIFPITQDMSLKGVVFYDGGAGWDNPYVTQQMINQGLVTGNSFDYRHAVGFGLRMLRPMPVRVDWGFKLDPRTGEKESQVHFGMTYDW